MISHDFSSKLLTQIWKLQSFILTWRIFSFLFFISPPKYITWSVWVPYYYACVSIMPWSPFWGKSFRYSLRQHMPIPTWAQSTFATSSSCVWFWLKHLPNTFQCVNFEYSRCNKIHGSEDWTKFLTKALNVDEMIVEKALDSSG